jgi:hypothetical protein
METKDIDLGTKIRKINLLVRNGITEVLEYSKT